MLDPRELLPISLTMMLLTIVGESNKKLIMLHL